jgi:NSS family neurotransmitter:Na+ symporter
MGFFKSKNLLHGAEQWSSTIGFVLATTGAAVGLGNIWMFPYVAGMNGGGAFVLIYLACVLIIGIPIMMSEALIGHYGHQNPIDCIDMMARVSEKSRNWRFLAVWGGIALICILSFYSVVSGWSLGYLYKTVSGLFQHATPAQITAEWESFLGNPWELLILHTIFMVATMSIVAFGVEKGLERASKIMMPGLIIILVMLVIYGIFNGNFAEGIDFLFKPDLSEVTAQSVLAAMGLAFFTLAIGASCIVTYASYLPVQTPITSNIMKVVALDTAIALLAGLAIFPLVFGFNLQPEAGPGLMFEVLPMTFQQMPGGQFIGALFFLLLIFAALTASISLAEPLVIMVAEKLGISRVTAVTIIGSIAWLMGIAVLLSFNHWEEVKIFGRWTFFAIATDIPTRIVLPIGGLLFAIFAGYKVEKHIAQKALLLKNDTWFNLWRFVVRYVSPVAIVIVFVSQFI